jgi:transcriptional regulator GlxA family with amidase domain
MTRKTPDPRITRSVDYIYNHLAEPLTVPMLAGLVGLSPSHFHTLFVMQTRRTPMQYLQRLRLRRARLLVERTFLSIREIMAQVGYTDASHFARDFRRVHGAPPTALREDGPVTPIKWAKRGGPRRARSPGAFSLVVV